MKARYLFDALLAAGFIALLANEMTLVVALWLPAVVGELTIAVIERQRNA